MADRLDRAAAYRILARAIELHQADDEGFSPADLVAVAAEIGVPERAVRAALREMGPEPPAPDRLARWLGPAAVTVTGTVPSGPARTRSDVSLALRRRGLVPLTRDDRWLQRDDWWPDSHRITAPVVVEVFLLPEPAGSTVGLRAALARARRNHLAGVLLGAGLAAVTPLLGPAALVAGAGLAGGAVAGYRYRVGLVRHRLENFIACLGAA